MATTKEATVVILDVSKKAREVPPNGDKSFFDKQKEYCTKLMQKKIFAGKKDELAFVLMGTEETENELNRNLSGYEYITEGIPMQLPNWKILTTLLNSIELENGSDEVDWIDAVVIALDILRREEAKKFKYYKVILFHQFMYAVDDSSTDAVIERIKEVNIEFVIICDRVKYKDDPNTNKTISFFVSSNERNADQRISESNAERIITTTDGVLCNFDIALKRMTDGVKPKGRPWFWYSTLDIGSKVKIHVGVTISVKTESPFQFKTESAQPHSSCFLATEYFKSGEKLEVALPPTNENDEAEKIKPEKQFALEELITAYMLGSTPIPYEKQPNTTKKSMQCIGFTSKSNVLPQFFVGSGTYLVFARPTMEVSEKMFASLVKALENKEMVMIGTRVYNDGYSPKFIALFPSKYEDLPCLIMHELYCAEQQVNWDFPILKTKRFQPSEEQYNAIDDLMNSMTLDDNLNNNETRDKYEKDLFPFKCLPNIINDYIMDVTTKHIIDKSKDISFSLQGRDDVFNVPESIYKKSEEPLQKIKELFPLEEVKKESKKELIRHLGNIDSRELDNELLVDEKPLEYKPLISVGTVTPAEDFKELVKVEVEALDVNLKEERTFAFDKITKQIQEVIKDLIFKTISLQYEKIVKSLQMYRDEAAQYNPYEFNDFIREIKLMAVSRKMYEFWEEIVVKNKLGLLSSKDCYFFNATDDVHDVEEFYKIDVDKPMELDNQNGDNVDDLFDDM